MNLFKKKSLFQFCVGKLNAASIFIEGRRFGAVDKIWKELMKQVHLDPAVMSVVDIDKMSEKLKKAFSLLEIIQKGLHTVHFADIDIYMFLCHCT